MSQPPPPRPTRGPGPTPPSTPSSPPPPMSATPPVAPPQMPDEMWAPRHGEGTNASPPSSFQASPFEAPSTASPPASHAPASPDHTPTAPDHTPSASPPPPTARNRARASAGLSITGPAQRVENATIEVNRVTCTFGPLVAVSDVSFSLGPGMTALLGPNGAGKSTLLRMMAGLEEPSSGTIRIMGDDPRTSDAARRQIGIVPQQDGVFDRQTAFEFVALAAELQGIENPEAAVLRAIDAVELTDAANRNVSSFSKGMRQRAKIAQALVADPPVVFLDEPLNGLDPKQRRQTIELFTRLADAGKTVVVSSHVLEEVERFGSRIVVIVQGRLGAEGDFRAIRQLMENQPLRFAIEANEPARLAAALLAGGVVSSVSLDSDRRFEVRSGDAAKLRRALPNYAHQLGIRVWSFIALDDDLESVFKYLVASRG